MKSYIQGTARRKAARKIRRLELFIAVVFLLDAALAGFLWGRFFRPPRPVASAPASAPARLEVPLWKTVCPHCARRPIPLWERA